MIVRNSLKIKVLLLFSVINLIFSLQTTAQNQMGFDPNDLRNIRVDELSDVQVMDIVNKAGGTGYTLEQVQAVAIKNGLPPSEAQKLRNRITKIQSQKVDAELNPNQSQVVSSNNDLNNSLNSSVNSGLAEGETVASNKLKSTVYGQDYFRSGDIKIFDKSSDAKAPTNYIIGIGDELGISIFGNSYYNEVLKVDSRGAVNPTQMGPIFVKGLTYERAKSLIKVKFNQYFDLSNNKIEVTLAYSRSITVNIVGEVIRPGSYKIPATNTAFNALILAGGPNDIGTLREINIKRNGKVVKSLDIYAFLNDPNSSSDFYLEDNDYLTVSTFKKVVTIMGEVKRATSYELLSKENLMSLLQYSGGLSSNAYRDKIQIRRSTSAGTRLIDLNLDSLTKRKQDFILENGDLVIIKSNVLDSYNKVTINGAINFPGDYNFTNGMKVLSLINIAGGIKIDSELENAYLIRTDKDQIKKYLKLNLKEIISNPNSIQNLTLEKLDQLMIYSSSEFIVDLSVEVLGSVIKPSVLKFVNGMTLEDAIRQSGGFNINAENLRVEVSRLNYFSDNYIDGQDVKVVIDRVQFDENGIKLKDTNKVFYIQPFDKIFVRTVPDFNSQQLIEIFGEVRYPGKYALLSKDEKISSVIKRAGGINKYAFAEAATFYRPSLAGNFVVVKMDEILNSENSRYNFTLKDGDIITIPTKIDFVGIRGTSLEYLSVLDRSQVNAPYVGGHRAKYYINKFGNGFTKKSWRRKTYVIQPNAKINRTRDFLIFKIYPKVTKGSLIYVVEKPAKVKKERKEDNFDWNRFVESTTSKVIGIATILVLFKQL